MPSCAASGFSAGQRQQIVDQPAHASGFRGHDFQKLFAGHGIVLGMTAQGLDEAGDRRKRRAQLVTGIGDKIGAHLLAALDHGEIVQQEHRHRRGHADARGIGLEMPFHRHRQGEGDVGGFAPARAGDGRQHIGIAQNRRGTLPVQARAQDIAHGMVDE